MDAKSKKILFVTVSVIAVAGIGYFIYAQQQQKKIAKILEKSVDEMTQQYQVFN